MGRNREMLSPVLLLFMLSGFVINLCNAEVLQPPHIFMGKQMDPCASKCKEASLPLINKDADPELKYMRACCERGCRFYNLINLSQELETPGSNNSLSQCDSSCTMAYQDLQELVACRTGCALMTDQRLDSFTPLFSIAIQFGDVQPNILFPQDTPDNNIFTDFGLSKELLPVWWNENGMKLPETYLKTIPIDTGSMDYTAPSEYLEENEKSTSLPGSDWLQCASRHTGIPRWLLALAIATAALSALWLCLSPEKPTDIEKVTLTDPSPTSKITVYLPDEAPLHKKPPPKYDEVVNLTDSSLKV
ncbi:uncharacterized protein LOC106641672 [Copidosoma floridanum]|uniref:uncharacterized protein LOC106641672 n=1 Tax=Copidosoma floridanum TaxID=29053 RepID=UPI0006C9B5B9|nr:uncharacterized protein LOC106641672 [Copidosoma floridanum]